jgi:hypothetical protein
LDTLSLDFREERFGGALAALAGGGSVTEPWLVGFALSATGEAGGVAGGKAGGEAGGEAG